MAKVERMVKMIAGGRSRLMFHFLYKQLAFRKAALPSF